MVSDGVRNDSLRKAYQRAVSIPMNDVEVFWREYDSFENELNKATVSTKLDVFPDWLLGKEANWRKEPGIHDCSSGI